jgi:hypothetical protein
MTLATDVAVFSKVSSSNSGSTDQSSAVIDLLDRLTIDAATAGPPSSKLWLVIKRNRALLWHKLAAQPAEDQSHNPLWIVGVYQLDIFAL